MVNVVGVVGVVGLSQGSPGKFQQSPGNFQQYYLTSLAAGKKKNVILLQFSWATKVPKGGWVYSLIILT